MAWSRRDLLKASGAWAIPFARDSNARTVPAMKAQLTRAAINAPVASIYSRGEFAWAATIDGARWFSLACGAYASNTRARWVVASS